ncbi:hypothetical protein LshimejAT787_1500440 [Lyophyllum shimeji]|uniref:Uncharacterized protein n=1 Tax=Lyophyllum shimeji TaxID=47721 RepID=A0A9P3PVS5_LYOSH|nr:hypothetical protein LshimejAT787_1500440 [Lyophyllum shimeji]
MYSTRAASGSRPLIPPASAGLRTSPPASVLIPPDSSFLHRRIPDSRLIVAPRVPHITIQFLQGKGSLDLFSLDLPLPASCEPASVQGSPLHQGTLQHRWMRQKKNVMPEIAWSQLRRRFSPGFEDVLEYGVQEEWYDIDNPLDVLVFRWIFIPWLQMELDAYRDRINNSKKCADRNKILPHGVPNDIYESPERYGCLDFKVKVDADAIDYMRELYTPPNDPVFELVPPSFEHFAEALYQTMGSPVVTRDNVWDLYYQLKQRFLHLDEALAHVKEWQKALEPEDNPLYELIPGQQDLLGGPDDVDEDGAYYMAGVNNGLGLVNYLYRSHHQELDQLEEEDEEVEVEQDDEDDMDEVEAIFGVTFTDQKYSDTDTSEQEQ